MEQPFKEVPALASVKKALRSGILLFWRCWGEHRGNWHWNLTGLLSIPIGQYDAKDISNLGVNRWAFDSEA